MVDKNIIEDYVYDDGGQLSDEVEGPHQQQSGS